MKADAAEEGPRPSFSHPDTAPLRAAEMVVEKIGIGPVFDVSGEHGAPGVTGIGLGHLQASTGQDGRRGGHGGPGHPGKPAGQIFMQLSTPRSTAAIPKDVILARPTDSDVMMDTSMLLPTGQSKKMETILGVQAGQSIVLLAKGGDGGRGGDGGNGEDGGTGQR
jgi:hypothetical protein